MADFCHLHCHTQYSLLDGAARIERLVASAAEMRMPALAITDHGNLFGVPEFYTTARKAGVKPIIGCEFYVTPSGMGDRADRTRNHQVLLARNEEGYRNLIRLSSLSFTDGYYYKPRIDRETLRAHAGGLVATTCCLQGEVPQAILKLGEEAARPIFEAYLEIFGKDYLIEIQDHGIEDQHRVNEVLLRWAKEYEVAVVATNDVHYVERDDHAAQDVLLCLQTGKDLYDPNRMRFENDQFFLKTPAQMEAAMASLDPAIRQQSLVNTLDVADRCNLELQMGKLLMPHYPLPDAFTGDMDGYLRHLVYEKAHLRYGELTLQVTERLDLELGIIRDMGYAGYFLIVQDFTTAARTLGVSVGPGRGSAAGSAVAYCLGITNIDPLKYDLLFERFLNPERVSMPDIDIDFDDRGRSTVIDYVVKKYGRENVCQIVTFGTMGPRSVIRDVARVLQIPLPDADRIAKMIPDGPGTSLTSAMADVPEFRKLLTDQNEQIRNLMHYAQVLEGSARHTGVHAAGVIIAPGRVSDYVPVAVTKGKSGADDVITTQYDGNWVEEFGLLKMDFLGLKTLTVLADAVSEIKRLRGVEIDLDEIPLDDPATFSLFQRADTVAIFQFESSGMREWLRKLKPTSIEDLIAMNALYRPGPMDLIPNYIDRKHGKEEVTYPHEMLREVLEPTYGIPVYQEQVMKMAQVMGGYTLGGADLLRRAMGKKKVSVMDKQRGIFVTGALDRGVDEKVAQEVFDMMAKFAGYGFNRSHAAAYSVVAYQTAYLKANYPSEFMAAALTNEMSDTKKLSVVLDEARHLGIGILPPSVNKSLSQFSVEGGAVRFGLGAIKGAGLGAIECIIQARATEGSFRSLFHLMESVDSRSVNKKAIDSLVRAGALDELEGHRAQQIEALDAAFHHAQRVQADKAAGQNSLFGGAGGDGAALLPPQLPLAEVWATGRRLKEEREVIGIYVSGHPLEAVLPEIRAFASTRVTDIPELLEKAPPVEDERGYSRGPVHTVCGIVTEVLHRRTKTGKPMLTATLEDFTGQADLVCFSNNYDRVQRYLETDQIIFARGEVELRGGSIKMVLQDATPIWKVRESQVKSVVLHVNPYDLGEEAVEKLYKLSDAHRGTAKLYFAVAIPGMAEPQRILARTVVVEPNGEFMKEVALLVGKNAVQVEGDKV
ncbi:MAG: DNA polymerase-3 subunit alpha [Rhodothermales bacterium]|jgi:DNA polymerase-3 subunit alpha